MKHRTRQILTVAACTAIAMILTRFTAGPVWLEGLYYDSALAAWAAIRPGDPRDASVLVVGLDAASLAEPELAARPRALFGPIWARTLGALHDAGAKVIAFDFILAFSGEAIAKGYDRDFLRALFLDREKIVLARSFDLLPARSYSAALGFSASSLGASEITPDGDGIYRNVLLEAGEDKQIPTLAGAALAKAGFTDIPHAVLLAPDRALESLPTLSLGQVLNCAADDPAALARAVKDRIVFIGSLLPEEDRKGSLTRFFASAPRTERRVGGCAPQIVTEAANIVPGVYLHAMAVETVMQRQAARALDGLLHAMIGGLAAGLAVAGALKFRPLMTVISALMLCVVLWLAEIASLAVGFHAPLGYPALLGVLSAGGGFALRFLFEERRRFHLQNAFGHYLAPELVERLASADEMPALGGEIREASVMFADLSGFTAMSGRIPAEQVVALTNQYLGLMAEEIEASNGYIDKYMGDAVMAVWGAPLPLADHAARAVNTGLRIASRIKAAHALALREGREGFSVKIGINSGQVVAGNVGARKRLNYTVAGDTVNVAARLESVPADYGCMVIIGEVTAQLLGGQYVLREIDRIGVKGREAPLAVFEPLLGTPSDITLADAYARALESYRAGEFSQASAQWEILAQTGDGPSRVMGARARELLRAPPDGNWDGVWRRTSK